MTPSWMPYIYWYFKHAHNTNMPSSINIYTPTADVGLIRVLYGEKRLDSAPLFNERSFLGKIIHHESRSRYTNVNHPVMRALTAASHRGLTSVLVSLLIPTFSFGCRALKRSSTPTTVSMRNSSVSLSGGHFVRLLLSWARTLTVGLQGSPEAWHLIEISTAPDWAIVRHGGNLMFFSPLFFILLNVPHGLSLWILISSFPLC